MSAEERARVVLSLPSEVPRSAPPEGDAHRIPKTRALEALDEYFRRIGRRIYLSSELPVYYPDERMFAPDLLAVLDVEPRERGAWVVSHEGKGLDLVLEVHVSGDARKDAEANVERYARLEIPEYFTFEPVRGRLLGYRLRGSGTAVYEPILPQQGRWSSRVLDLDLALDEGRLRFFHGSAPLLDARELIARLSSMVDDAVRRTEEEARRAERLEEKLRRLGVDPDEPD